MFYRIHGHFSLYVRPCPYPTLFCQLADVQLLIGYCSQWNPIGPPPPITHAVFVYNIPPRPTNRGYRASDWKLDAPDFTGRLKVVSRGPKLFIKIEDKVSGELFAQCPVDEYPGVALKYGSIESMNVWTMM